MKIVISAQGKDLDAPVDPRFGRAQSFIVYDLENDGFEYIDNTQNLNLPQGAGVQTAQCVANTGAKAVISGHIGPKAYAALTQGQMDVYFASAGTVGEAIEAYKNGLLQKANGADKPGHW